MSSLFGPIFGESAIADATSDRALLRALCDAEAALAEACAHVGLIESHQAAAVAKACAELAAMDPAELGLEAVAGGNPVIPLARRLQSAVPQAHFGATSQDILDTALMLISRDALALVVTDLRAIETAVASLADAHRSTPMIGRTLLQQAIPTTFGALAAIWGMSFVRVIEGLSLELPAQVGGAAGTMAGWHPHGFEVRARYAENLGLVDPGYVWHTDRTPVTQLAGALGSAAAAIAKVATDIVLLSQSEIAEVSEQAPGGSSAMPHKQNPIAAITARASAAQAPGLVATLLAAGSPELQRGAGPWHAEWPALVSLLRATGGAANRLRTSIEGLRVDPARMARALGPGFDLGHAVETVDRYLSRRTQ
ncbi:lyase family protein [Kribbella sp. NBC_01245]|uniref:lyase family protein n=1 Tax=Kribbella sp. NBC_01245 TaxID=2903578 RepID=UPI002E290D23|nr:lyase family protein [Kribbella sp. NBC_01245]